MPSPLEVARGFVGQRESSDRNDLLNRFLNGDTAGMSASEYAWCSRFVKAAADKAGVDTTGANDMARSWLNVGSSVDKPEPGDVAVFTRGNPRGPYGHVGFYEGTNPDGSIRIVGGNQGRRGEVSDASMPASRLLGYRRLSPATNAAPGPFQAADNIPPVLKAGYGRESGPTTQGSPTEAPGPAPFQVASNGGGESPSPSASATPAGAGPFAAIASALADGGSSVMPPKSIGQSFGDNLTAAMTADANRGKPNMDALRQVAAADAEKRKQLVLSPFEFARMV